MNSYGKMDRKNFDTMNKRYEMLIKFLPKRIAYKITIAIIWNKSGKFWRKIRRKIYVSKNVYESWI